LRNVKRLALSQRVLGALNAQQPAVGGGLAIGRLSTDTDARQPLYVSQH
jgi:hypothetical protein